MTNWQPRENITFICPDCEHEQMEMTKNCSVCGKRRLAPATTKKRLYEISFRMCNGTRKEKYLLLLTDEQVEELKKRDLDDEEMYEFVQNDLWNFVVTMYSDHGCDFGAIIWHMEQIDDPKLCERYGLKSIKE
jgi:hypothetical protein